VPRRGDCPTQISELDAHLWATHIMMRAQLNVVVPAASRAARTKSVMSFRTDVVDMLPQSAD
jgi:hypothetical protein